MRFKRQTNRSTREDETTNINLFLKNFSFGVVESNYWGTFGERNSTAEETEHKEHTAENPLIEIDLDGTPYELTLEELKKKLRKVLK
jgi:hypothetical protein